METTAENFTPKQIKKELSLLLKVASNIAMNRLSDDLEDWDLPKSTPVKVKKKIYDEASHWNEINRLRAIQLKELHHSLSEILRHLKVIEPNEDSENSPQ